MCSPPFSIALRSLQREMIRSDPAWEGGNYAPAAPPMMGMRLARKLGMITYRSAAEWRARFGRERCTDGQPGAPFAMDFEVESYLEAHAAKFIRAFDANCYLYLSRAMDLFDLADHGGSHADSLATLQLQYAMVLGVASDLLFPMQQQQELADGLARAGIETDFHTLPSVQGHDAFLVDMDRFRPLVSRFFRC